MAERGYSFSLTTFRYGRGSQSPPRSRGCRSSLCPDFYVLVSGLMLPGGPVANRDGNATLQSHFLGPPAAWEQRCREAAGTRVWGSRATLGLRAAEVLNQGFTFTFKTGE